MARTTKVNICDGCRQEMRGPHEYVAKITGHNMTHFFYGHKICMKRLTSNVSHLFERKNRDFVDLLEH